MRCGHRHCWINAIVRCAWSYGIFSSSLYDCNNACIDDGVWCRSTRNTLEQHFSWRHSSAYCGDYPLTEGGLSKTRNLWGINIRWDVLHGGL